MCNLIRIWKVISNGNEIIVKYHLERKFFTNKIIYAIFFLLLLLLETKLYHVKTFSQRWDRYLKSWLTCISFKFQYFYLI